ncbi:MAG: hypothetical protein AAF847_06515 [Bacteroidota bacterium]
MARTFRQLLGINAGKEWDQLYNQNNPYGYNPLRNIFSHVRSFHLMEDDYPKGELPSTAKPDVRFPEQGGWGRMNNYHARYQKWSKDFESIRVSLTGISSYDKLTKKVSMRKFPNKWYSKADLGGDFERIKANAKRYGLAFFQLHVPKEKRIAPLISTLEIGNEPWGDTGIEGYRGMIKGIIEAYQEYYGQFPVLTLSSAAFQAHQPKHIWKCRHCDYPSGDYVAKVLDAEIIRSIHELNVHPYSFLIGTTQLTEPPESESSDFSHAKSMFAYRDRLQRPDLKISATEFGWDSGTVGEVAQAAYTIRNVLMMASMGFHQCYLYEGLDNPALKSLYGSSGLFRVHLPGRHIRQPKLIYKSLLQFMNLLGDMEMQAAWQENEAAYLYLLGGGNGQKYLVAWRPLKIAKDDDGNQTSWIKIPDWFQQKKLRLDTHFHQLDGKITLDDKLRCQKQGQLYATKDYMLKEGSSVQLKLSAIPYVFPLLSSG